MPTDIRYSERIVQPFQSDREVRVYGEDRERRLQRLSTEVGAFEKAITNVVTKFRDGTYIDLDRQIG